MDPAADHPLIELRSPTGTALVAAAVLASMVAFLDANVVNVAIPAIGTDLGAGVEALQWSLTGYLVTAAALLLLSGALADRFGRRRILMVGLATMFVASVLCAVAPSIGALVAARVVQGAGAAMVVPSSLALLNGTLREIDRARGIGIWAGLATLGTTVGPYAGGWLVDHSSWRWVFILNVPLILAALLTLLPVPESAPAYRPLSVDVRGAVLAVAGLGGVIYALTAGASHGWLRGRVIVAAVIGVGALAALIPAERRQAAPMLRLSLFASRQFDAINLTTVLLYGSLGAASYLLVLQCELQLGFSAAQAGAALIPSSIVFLALSPVSGFLVSRVGPRWLMVAGIAVIAVAFAELSGARAGRSYAHAVLPGVLLWGLGIGLMVTPLTSAVLAAVDDDDLGEASAVNDASARFGSAVAVAVVPLLIGAGAGTSLGHALTDGYRPAMLVLTGVTAASAVVAALFVSNEHRGAPALAPQPLHRGCALPVVDRSTRPVPVSPNQPAEA